MKSLLRRLNPSSRAGLRNLRVALFLAAMIVLPGCAALLWGTGAGLLVAGLTLAGSVPFMRHARGVPVLTYHSVSEDASWLPWADHTSIRPATLDRQLRLMRRMGLRFADTAELVRARLAGKPLPRNVVALHFDDGYLDTWVAAWPLLKRHGACASVFVSTDFIAPDQPLRPTLDDKGPHVWDGFMSWRELRVLAASPEFQVEAHGTDHGRIETGPAEVARLDAANYRQMAWVQWAQMPGSKHDWYKRAGLQVPLGTVVRENAPALSARGWSAERGLESLEAYDRRLRDVFATSAEEILEGTGRRPQIFCWPQNVTNDRARALAAEAGFIATTAGQGRNTAAERADVISRVHAGQDYAGFRCGWLDDLALRSHLRCMQGNFYWGIPLLGISVLRYGIGALRRGAGAVFQGGRLPDTAGGANG